MEPVRRGVAGLTPLRIKQQFSTIDICPSTFPFRLCRREQHPSWQRPMEDGRYAPLTLNIRSQWHHRGAYLHKNVEICTADPQYTLPVASSGSISPQKCRDMRGRSLVYAFSSILPVHISFGITSGCPICDGLRTSEICIFLNSSTL